MLCAQRRLPVGAVLPPDRSENCILLAGKRDFIEIQRIAVISLLVTGCRVKLISSSPGISDTTGVQRLPECYFVEPFLPVTPADLHILRR